MTKGDEGKNREIAYITRADIIGVAQDSLLSQGLNESQISGHKTKNQQSKSQK
eukprot:CAMPEP_0176456646 /NCGR_PEP_ID=MMETSP0127-20121128/31421_1 /TAXON_ID=938130 /ORGANISM="Platyophrya macrostoma, Strain WH" /LENGTH=52 /DNA_ID=CAMNT_0017846663 /DNA_START=19 /DNA_END=174 /DNA_ORIENTATION=-